MATTLSDASYRLSHRATFPSDPPSRQEPQPAKVLRVLKATRQCASPPSTDTYQERRKSIAQDPSSDHPVEASSESPNTEVIDREQGQLPTQPTTEPVEIETWIIACINSSSNLIEVARLSPRPRPALDLKAINENHSGLSSADKTPTVEAQQHFRDDIDIRSPTLSTASDLEHWEWSACA